MVVRSLIVIKVVMEMILKMWLMVRLVCFMIEFYFFWCVGVLVFGKVRGNVFLGVLWYLMNVGRLENWG